MKYFIQTSNPFLPPVMTTDYSNIFVLHYDNDDNGNNDNDDDDFIMMMI